jgi:hypothetical protein
VFSRIRSGGNWLEFEEEDLLAKEIAATTDSISQKMVPVCRFAHGLIHPPASFSPCLRMF